MYLPGHFEERRIEVLHGLVRAMPLSTLVTLSPDGLDANHIPLVLDAEPAPLGTLRGHVARANPVWKEGRGPLEALAVFHGPDAYITPSWYPGKGETGKAVPTWNYLVVHAHGQLRFIDDAEWLRDHLERLTDQQEAAFDRPWRLSDAPPEYLEKMIGAVVGVEMVIARLQGKWKLSQNQPQRNRLGVVEGLRRQGGSGGLEIAALIEEGSAR